MVATGSALLAFALFWVGFQGQVWSLECQRPGDPGLCVITDRTWIEGGERRLPLATMHDVRIQTVHQKYVDLYHLWVHAAGHEVRLTNQGWDDHDEIERVARAMRGYLAGKRTRALSLQVDRWPSVKGAPGFAFVGVLIYGIAFLTWLPRKRRRKHR